jgi:hypothetical protein
MVIELSPEGATAFVPGGRTESLRLTAAGDMRSIAETRCA